MPEFIAYMLIVIGGVGMLCELIGYLRTKKSGNEHKQRQTAD